MTNLDFYFLFPKIYHNLLFMLVLITCMRIINNGRHLFFVNFGYTKARSLLFITVLLIAFLPIPWSLGGDRLSYVEYFKSFELGKAVEIKKDFLFYKLMELFSFFTNYTFFYFVIAFVYVYSRYYFAKKQIPNNIYLMLLAFLSSFSFYAYGTNTIRAGFAISILLFAITYWKKNWLFYPLLLLSWSVHGSVIIPIFALLIAKFYTKPKLYYRLWFISIAVSFASGKYFELFFANLMNDSRSSYLIKVTSKILYNIGFRWDFLIYSSLPVFIGGYYLFKLKFINKFYSIIFSTYLITNLFWILIIRSNFSDRFAYLSWFLYPIILVYPPLVAQIWKNSSIKVAFLLFINAFFTYFMFLKG